MADFFAKCGKYFRKLMSLILGQLRKVFQEESVPDFRPSVASFPETMYLILCQVLQVFQEARVSDFSSHCGKFSSA